MSLIFVFSLLTFSCAGTFNEAGDEDHAIRYSAAYHSHLENVERPDSAISIYGVAKFDSIPNDTNFYSYFEDRAVKILWGLSSRFINCSVINKTESTIKILWNEAAYVDERRASHPLGHGRQYYLESSPSIILSKTFFEDGLYPSDYPYIPIGEAFGGPIRKTLFLDFELHGPVYHGKYRSIDEFRTAVSSNLWSTVQILLPMDIEGHVYNYLFSFRISNITTTRTVHDISKYKY